jgi:hypothetical protein
MSMVFLSWLTGIYTFVLFGVQVAEFWTAGRFHVHTSLPNGLYLMFLSAYVGSKEVQRWKSNDPPRSSGRRAEDQRFRIPGEFFVGLWALFLLVAWFFSETRPQDFAYPDGLTTIAFEVLGFYVGSSASKWLSTVRETEAHQEVEAILSEPAPGTTPKSAAEAAPRAPHALRKRDRYEQLVLEKAKAQGFVTREDVEGMTGLSRNAAWYLLENLERRRRLKQEGERGSRSARYVPA